jgi:LytR cell envelope-related transcriptional attenuator
VEQRALIRGVLGAVLVLAVAGGAALAKGRVGASSPAAQAPPGVRIRVQVLNATTTRGLARRATGYLRDRGFDVVGMATASQPRDSTLIIDHAGNAGWAQLVARAFGGAPVQARPDSSRYLDVTVLVGRDWTPPAEPFYP